MTFEQILFISIAAATLGAALLVVTSRNLIHSALWLIASLFGIAVFFVFLDAGFFAVVQVVVYIGAIAILIIFAIMLTRRVIESPGLGIYSNWVWATLISFFFFGSIVWVLINWPGINKIKPPMLPSWGSIETLGISLVSPEAYVLPFELASILLFAALIGAIVIAMERR